MWDLRRSTSADHVDFNDLFSCRIIRGQDTGAKSFQRDRGAQGRVFGAEDSDRGRSLRASSPGDYVGVGLSPIRRHVVRISLFASTTVP